jgi:hypothetical protein
MSAIEARPLARHGLLPPPLAGEGWGGGDKISSCVPPPCPSPASGGGDVVALVFAAAREVFALNV